jgi:aminoglycoside 2'-N-acetyltransferase I
VAELRHTADLDDATRAAIRGLMESVFTELDGAAFDNALGGMHALVLEEGELIGHASVVQRRLLHGGRALRTGFIEGVAVRPDRQRRGLGHELMQTLERVVRGGYHLGALGSSEMGERLYAARGWQRWRGPTFVLAPGGVRRTEGASVWVLPGSVPLDLDGELTCDFREGSPW